MKNRRIQLQRIESGQATSSWRSLRGGRGTALCGAIFNDYVNVPREVNDMEAVFTLRYAGPTSFKLEPPYGLAGLSHLTFYTQTERKMRNAYRDGYRYVHFEYTPIS